MYQEIVYEILNMLKNFTLYSLKTTNKITKDTYYTYQTVIWFCEKCIFICLSSGF